MSKPSDVLLENYRRYRSNPWAFLTECVFTLDQVKANDPIRRFPDKEYLELYCKFWEKYPLLAIPKSRRMTMSWITISLYVWDAIFHKGRFFAFVSKKEDDANELITRAKFIVDNLDKDKIHPDLIPKYNHKFNVLEFPELNSKIQGFPQGADQLRQYTFSGIFGDESAFWEYAEKFYAASFPTLDGGGRMTLVSSPAPGFFKKLCFDAMDVPGEINVSAYSPDDKILMPGVRVWQNKKNKFLVFELHYTADPEKRSPDYKESIKNSMPIMEYLREYELHWDTFEGHPVYPEFTKAHILTEKPGPAIGLPMLIAFDWGLTPACCIAQFEDGVFTVFEEITGINIGAERFLEEHVIPKIRLTYRSHPNLKKDWVAYGDPAGMFKAQSDESTCFQKASKFFNINPGPTNFEERKNSLSTLLRKLTANGPALRVYAKECPLLTKGFEGGYRYDGKSVDIEPSKLRPLKNIYSHIMEATQYCAWGIQAFTSHTTRSIPIPKYFPQGPKHGSRIL